MEAEWEGKFLEKCGKQESGVRNENKGRIKLSSVCVFAEQVYVQLNEEWTGISTKQVMLEQCDVLSHDFPEGSGG